MNSLDSSGQAWKFNVATYRIPSFVPLIAVGGIVVAIQLLMVHFKTGKAFFSPGADHVTFFYLSLIAFILLLSVLVPLLAYGIRKKAALVEIDTGVIRVREKALAKRKSFLLIDIANIKLFVSEQEKRSSLRIEFTTGQVVLLQFYHVIIDAAEFKSFMRNYASIEVKDW